MLLTQVSIESCVADCPAARSRAWLLPATLPLLLASVVLVAAFARVMSSVSRVRLGEIAESHWWWLSSLAFGSGVALTSALFLAMLARFVDPMRAVRFLKYLTSFWPLEAAICSIGVLSILADRFRGDQSSVISRLVNEVWLPVFFFFLFTGIGSLSIRRAIRSSVRSDSPEAKARAAADAASTLGIPKRHAEKLANRTWRRSQTKIPAASILLSAWWLWNSPSWALLPKWSISSVPIGGQFLVSRFSEQEGFESGLMGFVLVLSVAAILGMLEWAGTPKIRRSGSAS